MHLYCKFYSKRKKYKQKEEKKKQSLYEKHNISMGLCVKPCVKLKRDKNNGKYKQLFTL